MKQIFILLMVAMCATIFTACSKDDDGDNVRGTNGERLVSKVVLIEAEDKSEDIYEFQYDKNGQMTKAINYYGYSTETYTYTRSENKYIVEHISVDETEGEEPDSHKTVCVLNNKGLITSFKDFNEEAQMTYDDKNQLIDDGMCKYTWKDGNIVKVTTGNTEYTYTYGNYEKKTNISDMIANWAEFYDYSYFGAENKNLVTSKSHSDKDGSDKKDFSYEYGLDKDGYVITMKEYRIENGTKILTATLTVEYK